MSLLLAPFRYAYTTSRVRGMFSRLPTAAQLEELLRIESAAEVFRRTQSMCGVQIPIRGSGELNLFDVERTLEKYYLNTLHQLSSFLPSAARPFTEALTLQHRNESIAQLIRAGISSSFKGGLQSWRIDRETDELAFAEAFMKARDLRAAIELIEDKDLRHSLLTSYDRYSAGAAPSEFDWALNRDSCTRLWCGSQKLKGADRSRVKPLLVLDIEAFNTLTVLRGKFFSTPIEQVRKQLLDSPFTRAERYQSALEAGSLEEASLRLPFLKPLGPSAASLPLPEVELWCKRRKAKYSLNAFLRWPFHLGLVYAFLNLKSLEIHDLRLISIGKSSGIGAETLRQGLVFISQPGASLTSFRSS